MTKGDRKDDLSFGRLTSEELVELLIAARRSITTGNSDQRDAWNRLFGKAIKEVEKRLNSDSPSSARWT